MTTATTPVFDGYGDIATRAFETWHDLWVAELQVLSFWQQTLLGAQRGLFDVWASHFAGGVPLDG